MLILPPGAVDNSDAIARSPETPVDAEDVPADRIAATIEGPGGDPLGELVLDFADPEAADGVAADDLEDVLALAAALLHAPVPTGAPEAAADDRGGLLFREFLKAAPAAIAMFDRKMRFLAVSSSYRTLFGLTDVEILGRTLYDVVPDLPAEWADQHKRCLAGQPIAVERDEMHVGGARKFVRRHLDPWFEAEGVVGGILSWCDDISLRVTAETMLAENQHFFRTVLESVDEGLSACDANGRVLFRNRRLREMHQLDDDQAERASLPADALNLYRVGGTSRLRASETPLFRALAGGRIVEEPLEIRIPGQAPRQILLTAVPMQDAHGACLGAVVSERDVTKSVEALRLLREANARYLAIFNNTFQFCALLAPSGEVLEVNHAALRMSGLSRADVIGTRFWELASFRRPRGLAGRISAAFRRVRTGATARYEIDFVDAAGRSVPLDCALVPVHDETGALVNILAEGRDVTEVRRNEAAIRRHEQELRLILNNVPSRIMVKNAHNEILRCNRAAADALGRTVAEVEGARLDALRPDIAAREWRANLRTIAEGVLVSAAPRPDDMTDGRAGWVSTTRVPFADAATGEQLVCVVSTDVTDVVEAQLALRESEYQHRQMFRRTPMMLQSTDLEGALEHVSDHWLDRLGYTRDGVLFRPFTDFMSAASRDRAVAARAAAAPPQNGGTQTMRDEYEFVCADGTVLTIELSELFEWDADGRCNRVIGVLTDMTERRRAERELMHMQRMESVGQLTGGLAHDFNNLLCVVQGNLELLESSVANDPAARRRVNAAAKAVESGARLTRRMLTFARRQPLTRSTLDLVTLVRGMTGLLHRAAGEAVRITVEAPETTLAVNTDPSQVEAALLNLTVNARDAMPNGGSLNISLGPVTFGEGKAPHPLGPGDYVHLSVTDTGEGIAPELQSRVLEPFFTTKHSGAGTGLGLSMVYGFMQQTGGAISLSSRLGEGTTIDLYFPQSTDMVAPPPALAASDAPAGPAGNATVLIVEDQPEVRVVLVEALKAIGYMTIEAGDVSEAEEVLAAFEVDLVLSDVVLPGALSGVALARKLFESRPDLPVVMMSGNADAEMVLRDRPGGRIAMLRKPFQRDELARAIAEALA